MIDERIGEQKLARFELLSWALELSKDREQRPESGSILVPYAWHKKVLLSSLLFLHSWNITGLANGW